MQAETKHALNPAFAKCDHQTKRSCSQQLLCCADTHRKHAVLLPLSAEMQMGEATFKQVRLRSSMNSIVYVLSKANSRRLAH